MVCFPVVWFSNLQTWHLNDPAFVILFVISRAIAVQEKYITALHIIPVTEGCKEEHTANTTFRSLNIFDLNRPFYTTITIKYLSNSYH